MKNRFYIEIGILSAWWVLVCVLQPPSYFQPDAYAFYFVPFLFGAFAWGAIKEPAFKPHYRHQDINWILKKDWFQKIIFRQFWRPQKMTLLWKIVLMILLMLPGVLIAFGFKPEGATGWDLARHASWSLLLGLSMALGGTMILESIMQQALGNAMSGLVFAMVAFSGFYVWKRPVEEKLILTFCGLVVVGLSVFATDLARQWQEEVDAG